MSEDVSWVRKTPNVTNADARSPHSGYAFIASLLPSDPPLHLLVHLSALLDEGQQVRGFLGNLSRLDVVFEDRGHVA